VLGSLPLALEQAAAYLIKNPWRSLADYLGLLRTRMAELLREGKPEATVTMARANTNDAARCVLLAQGVPLFGALQALGMTTAVFAFGHWFGHPSGPTGVVLAALAGATWGWSIPSTRGIGWAWIIHGIQDLVILLAIAATA
jgi:hypothetical protein